MSKYFKVIAENRKARHDYTIIETVQTGIMLSGSEVKSVRSQEVNFRDSFARADGNELWLYNLYIKPYKFSKDEDSSDRRRKLLLKERELKHLLASANQKGLTLIPLKIYLSGDWVKIDLGIAKSKKLYDKREVKKKRDLDRQMERDLSLRNK
ncbi:MAG: SsrA-binding protein SmpB [bacterium]